MTAGSPQNTHDLVLQLFAVYFLSWYSQLTLKNHGENTAVKLKVDLGILVPCLKMGWLFF